MTPSSLIVLKIIFLSFKFMSYWLNLKYIHVWLEFSYRCGICSIISRQVAARQNYQSSLRSGAIRLSLPNGVSPAGAEAQRMVLFVRISRRLFQ
jgi:hypothetical protein